MKPMHLYPLSLGLALLAAGIITNTHAQTADLWALAQKEVGTHRFSTLFTAHDVRRYLASEEGLNQAMDWCKKTAITKVPLQECSGGFSLSGIEV